MAHQFAGGRRMCLLLPTAFYFYPDKPQGLTTFLGGG